MRWSGNFACRALAGSGVPVAGMMALCEDESVIGSVFYLMEHVAGRTAMTIRACRVPRRRIAARCAFDVRDGARSGSDPPGGFRGLKAGDYGPHGGYIRRQIDRWTKQYRASETEPLADMDALMASALDRPAARRMMGA